ncbi:MAG: hypothetical protein AB1Z23_03500 [Eubacteriales bacterium]
MSAQNLSIDIVGLFFKVGTYIYKEQKYLKTFEKQFINTINFTNRQIANDFNAELKLLFSQENAEKLRHILKKVSEYDVKQTLAEFFENQLILINQNSDFKYMLNEYIKAYTHLVMEELKKSLPEKYKYVLLGSIDKAITDGFIDVNSKLDEIQKDIASIKNGKKLNDSNGYSSSQSSASSSNKSTVDININVNSNDAINTYRNNSNYTHPHYQTYKNSKKSLGIKIFLWLFFPYIMVFVVICASKKLSTKTKLILCGSIMLFFLLLYAFSEKTSVPLQDVAHNNASISDNSINTENDIKEFYIIGEEAINSDFEILFADFFVDSSYNRKILVIEMEIKYIGDSSSGIHPSYTFNYKLNDSDGLVFEKTSYHSSSKTLPHTLESGDKGIAQVAFDLDYEVESDLMFRIFSDSYNAECDFKCSLPKDNIIRAINEFDASEEN